MFKHSRVKQTWPAPEQVQELVPKSSFVSSLGADVVSFEVQPADGASLPNYSDYQLSALLASGVPLNDLSQVQLDAPPSASDLQQLEKTLDINDEN